MHQNKVGRTPRKTQNPQQCKFDSAFNHKEVTSNLKMRNALTENYIFKVKYFIYKTLSSGN